MPHKLKETPDAKQHETHATNFTVIRTPLNTYQSFGATVLSTTLIKTANEGLSSGKIVLLLSSRALET